MAKDSSMWMQGAVKRKGVLNEKAKRAGMSKSEYCAKKDLDTRTKRQCALWRTFNKFRPGEK